MNTYNELDEAVKNSYRTISSKFAIGGLKATAATIDQEFPINIGFMSSHLISDKIPNNIIFSKAEIEIAVVFKNDTDIKGAKNDILNNNIKLHAAVELLNPLKSVKDYNDAIKQNAGFAYCLILSEIINKDLSNLNFSFQSNNTLISDTGNISKLKGQHPLAVAKEMLEVLEKVNPDQKIQKGFALITGSLITPIHSDNLKNPISIICEDLNDKYNFGTLSIPN